MRKRKPSTPEPANGAPASGSAPTTGHLLMLIAGRPVTADTPLQVGDALQAEWQGAWWPAEVIGLRADGRVKIHYPGWDASWDEFVPRARLRIEAPGPHRIKVVTDNGVSLSGTFVTAAEGYLVLRGAGRKKVFVNQQKVSYFEVEEE